MKYLCLVLLFCVVPVQASCVILLHGLARTADSMEYLAERLSAEGYSAINLGYPSREHPIEILAELAIKPAIENCAADTPISFVTHSMGGILVRQYLSVNAINQLHRVVMLAPPNQGSEVVDSLQDVWGFHLINGDAGMQLGTDENSVPVSLGAADFDVGIIAGTSTINPILSTLIPEVDDGKVSVERTKLEGMQDHLAMDVSHPFIMSNDDAIDQVIHYLRNGHFARASRPEISDETRTETTAQSPPEKIETVEKTQE